MPAIADANGPHISFYSIRSLENFLNKSDFLKLQSDYAKNSRLFRWEYLPLNRWSLLFVRKSTNRFEATVMLATVDPTSVPP